MAKLKLVIADADESYIRGLSEYINSNHSADYLVSCFTRADSFRAYMDKHPIIDIFLAGPEFCDSIAETDNIKLKLLLSAGTVEREYPGFNEVNKYNTGEKLLSEVAYLYSQYIPFELRHSSHSISSMLVGVYSASGGTGKTTIAVSLSAQCAELGMKCFYLNLESLQSTGAFFNSDSKRNLSYGFYYLKEKRNNLSFKLNGIKNTDFDYGVQYFSPPESPLEYEEVDSAELECLIQGIRELERYDCIFIDMSSVFDRKTRKLMQLCDKIILVNLQEPMAMHKSKLLDTELMRLKDTGKDSMNDKFIYVINRYKDNGSVIKDCSEGGISAAIQIPEYSRVLIKEDGRLAIDDEGFRNAINRIIKTIMEQ